MGRNSSVDPLHGQQDADFLALLDGAAVLDRFDVKHFNAESCYQGREKRGKVLLLWNGLKAWQSRNVQEQNANDNKMRRDSAAAEVAENAVLLL